MVATYYTDEARREWFRARRKARQAQALNSLEGCHEELLDFSDVSQRLNLMHAIYRGLQDVPLDSIVGSVGRYLDFTSAFLPSDNSLRERWERIAALYLDPRSTGVPPIELFKVGSAYFVKDGNHRVSVARQLELADIEAYVWEYPPPVAGLDPDTDIDTLLLEVGRRQFLEQTGLDRLRPNHGIRFTEPGGYQTVLREIEDYQIALSQIDGVEVSYERAVLDWYDLLYETTIQALDESGVMQLFPERTIADFYVWVRAYHAQLQERYQRRVTLHDAARDFRRRQHVALPVRTLRGVIRWFVQQLA